MSQIILKSIKSRHLGGSDRVLSGVAVTEREVVLGGGARAVDLNGTYSVGQLYVTEYRLASPRHPWPVLLWHGGGMTGAQWEATPDGRTGWLWRLLQAGFDVLVSDGPERGRASWAMVPQIFEQPPLFRTKEDAWSVFRLGPAGGYHANLAQRRAFTPQQFPVHAFDAFARQFVPRWTGHDDMALAAYQALVEQTGPCFLIGHSQGGGYAAHIARRCPGLVRAVVAVEPTGVPVDAALPVAPHLVVWGDHFEAHALWRHYRSQAEHYWQQLIARGQIGHTLDLPAQQILGNSHFCMSDRNSDDIADLVGDWLAHQSAAPHSAIGDKAP
ncbi:esterase [Variovorax sp. LT1R16]|uniref:esterase n=1 Tax=Variovorax sp. LT1R16 TaxID=3443728 RepID=UPI003F46FBEE